MSMIDSVRAAMVTAMKEHDKERKESLSIDVYKRQGNGSTRYNHQRGNEFKSVPFTASTASNQSFTIPGSRCV